MVSSFVWDVIDEAVVKAVGELGVIMKPDRQLIYILDSLNECASYRQVHHH